MQESKKLIEILEKHNLNGFDKPGGTDKATWHSYTGVYEHLMSAYINQKSVDLLEIGVQLGGSSLLWQEFLTNSNLYLVDINDTRHPSVIEKMDKTRSKFYQLDAYSDHARDLLASECSAGFDIIIDDGPHTLESQILCIKNFLPLLKPSGVMIIEDLQSIDWVNELMKHVPTEHADGVKVFDLTQAKGRYDDIMFVISKS